MHIRLTMIEVYPTRISLLFAVASSSTRHRLFLWDKGHHKQARATRQTTRAEQQKRVR